MLLQQQTKRPPEGGLSDPDMRVKTYAAAILRRHKAISPPSAIITPGRPAPTIGPGTAEAEMLAVIDPVLSPYFHPQ